MDPLLTGDFFGNIERLRASWYCLTLFSTGNPTIECFASRWEGNINYIILYLLFFF